MTEFLLPSLLNLLDPLNILLMIAGLTGGILIGAMPGLSATMGVALMVPVTFVMNPISGLVMLGAIYVGAIYGGANSAILICTPGTPSSVATTFDGWPLCKKGRADLGLFTSLISSAFGGIIGTLFLLCFAASLARWALKFGGPETFWLCLFGLSTIAVMSPGNMGKGILSGAAGILVSTVGLDPNTAVPRFTFGIYEMIQGIAVIPCMIGLFSFSQVLYLIGTNQNFIAEYNPQKGAFKEVFKYLFRHCKTILVRSSVIGTGVGMLPGAGGEIASIIAYNETKRWDKDPSRYGKGAIEGVAASESANNAVIGGSLIPMLTLGIPGSAVAAVILGALLAHGIQPGFKIFTVTGDLAYTFIISQFAVNILMVPVGFIICRYMAKLLSIRLTLVAIGIVVLSYVGSYAISNSMMDIWLVFVFGLIGFLGGKVGLDTGAMALGVILGPMIEENLGKCFDLARAHDGGLMGILTNGVINKILIVVFLLSLATPFLLKLRKKGALLLAGPKPSWSVDCLAGCGFFCFAAAFYIQFEDFTGVSRIFPESLTTILAIGGAYFIFKGIWRRFRSRVSTPAEPVAWKKVALISILSLGYAVAIPMLGFLVSTCAFIFCSTLILGDRTSGLPRLASTGILFAIIFGGAVWLTFTKLLNVSAPTGWFI